MKRFHVNVSVDDLVEGVRFYTALFATAPTVRKDDYAKWMLEDPRINFAISQRGYPIGVNHLGIQVDSSEDLQGLQAQLMRADQALVEQPGAACCYAHSNKYWVTDPAGVAWEAFHTLETLPIYGAGSDLVSNPGTCCASLTTTTDEPRSEPATLSTPACCARSP